MWYNPPLQGFSAVWRNIVRLFGTILIGCLVYGKKTYNLYEIYGKSHTPCKFFSLVTCCIYKARHRNYKWEIIRLSGTLFPKNEKKLILTHLQITSSGELVILQTVLLLHGGVHLKIPEELNCSPLGRKVSFFQGSLPDSLRWVWQCDDPRRAGDCPAQWGWIRGIPSENERLNVPEVLNGTRQAPDQ